MKLHFECSGLEKRILLLSIAASLKHNVSKIIVYPLPHLLLIYVVWKHIVQTIIQTYSTREKLFSLMQIPYIYAREGGAQHYTTKD